jgi:hypothetical protein
MGFIQTYEKSRGRSPYSRSKIDFSAMGVSDGSQKLQCRGSWLSVSISSPFGAAGNRRPALPLAGGALLRRSSRPPLSNQSDYPGFLTVRCSRSAKSLAVFASLGALQSLSFPELEKLTPMGRMTWQCILEKLTLKYSEIYCL